jgi:dihydrodipicolinate synthase/N-acetylneuraminate lyase
LIDSTERLKSGAVIPAHPLALTSERKLDERRQRALTRYYLASGAQGIAVAVHTTQFQIHSPTCGLLRPVLELAIAECGQRDIVKIAGVIGNTHQAVKEAELAAELGYDIALVSMGDLPGAGIPELLDHIRAVAQILPVMGFYLQPAVSGRPLPYEFWRGMAEISGVIAIKVAPFNRYHTLDVMRGVLDSSRSREISLYTGNDDNIVADLMTTFPVGKGNAQFAGGLLGQWAVWTSEAVALLEEIKEARASGSRCVQLLGLGQQLTDANSAIFDFVNGYRGCIPGIHEILRRQGLLAGTWCLDPNEALSPGQTEELDRILIAYPHLCDDAFVQRNLDEWLK